MNTINTTIDVWRNNGNIMQIHLEQKYIDWYLIVLFIIFLIAFYHSNGMNLFNY